MKIAIFLSIIISFSFSLSQNISEKLYVKGEKIYQYKCDKNKIDALHASSKIDLEKMIIQNKSCQALNSKELSALSSYVWDIKLGNAIQSTPIEVPKKAKCPICGMFVAKYPHWVAVIEGEHTHYFDGVKDMMKFIFQNPKALNQTIKVTNYFTFGSLDAKNAWYVIGSNVYGPMGNELIPFASKTEAESFKERHYGTKILKFEEINKTIINGLD